MITNNIALSLNYIAIIPIVGIGIGCSILVANRIGAQYTGGIRSVILASACVAAMYVSVMVSMQFLATKFLIELFAGQALNQEALSKAIKVVRVLWTYAFTFFFSMNLGGALEAQSLTKVVFTTRLVLSWGVSFPLIVWHVH